MTDSVGDSLPSEGLEAIVAGAPQAIIVVDPATTELVEANPAAATLLGMDRDQLRSGDIGLLSVGERGYTRDRLVTLIREEAADGSQTVEWIVKRSDDQRRQVELTFTRATVGGNEWCVVYLDDIDEQHQQSRRDEGRSNARRQLSDIGSRTDLTFGEKIERMLELGCERLGLDYGFQTRIEAGTQYVEQSRGDHERLQAGEAVDLAGSYCRMLADSEVQPATVMIDDVAGAGMTVDDAYDTFELGCYYGTEVVVDGEPYGTVCFADDAPADEPPTTEDRHLVDLIAGWISRELERERQRDAVRHNEQLLDSVFDNVESFIGVLEPDGTLVQANDAAWQLVDADSESLVGEPFWEGPWWDHDPELRDQIRDAIERAGDGETVTFETTALPTSHRPMDVEVRVRPIQTDEGAVRCIVVHGVDITAQRQQKEQMERLADATERLFYAGGAHEVGEITLDIAADVLRRPFSGIWEFDESANVLHPKFATDEVLDRLGETDPTTALPTLEPGTVEMEAFRNDEFRVIEDYQAIPDDRKAHPDAPLGTLLIATIGEYGCLHVGTPEVSLPTETERNLVRVLARHAEAAIDSVRREQEIIEYRDEIERRAEQMEFFNGILRHDMLNSLEIIRHRADVLEADLDGDHGQHAETITTWTDNIIELTQKVRSVLETLTDEGEPELGAVDVESVVTAEADRVRQLDPGVSVDVDVPEGIEVRADDLLGEVLGNLLTNAVEHNDSESPAVAVTASEADDGHVLLRVGDNGPGIPEDQRETLLGRGATGAQSGGSGFGLYFVASMVEAYGGTVTIGESDRGGAEFVLELPAPAPRQQGGLSWD